VFPHYVLEGRHRNPAALIALEAELPQAI